MNARSFSLNGAIKAFCRSIAPSEPQLLSRVFTNAPTLAMKLSWSFDLGEILNLKRSRKDLVRCEKV